MIPTAGCGNASRLSHCPPCRQTPRAPFQTLAKFDSEFRNGLGYHQPLARSLRRA
jgi:pyruvate-ferredoxin/flavodoxin oxidoreductase